MFCPCGRCVTIQIPSVILFAGTFNLKPLIGGILLWTHPYSRMNIFCKETMYNDGGLPRTGAAASFLL